MQHPDHPVVNVSWLDVQAYLTWLRQVTGDGSWQLPTEAEWEKTARWDDHAQQARVYPWGDQWDKRKANTSDGGPKTTTPVGQYANSGDASPYDCHDMAGNVWEWCSSLYFNEAYQPYNKRENMYDHTNYRVVRGGSWRFDPSNARGVP